MVQVNDRAYVARVSLKEGGVFVEDESGELMSGTTWIIQRIARLSLLAERILQFVPETREFVNPEAMVVDNLDETKTGTDVREPDAVDSIRRMLDRRVAYTSSVVYLTSDAGEGKTTLINELARQQANDYKNRKTDWLLVPIALGGRPFIRFDDVIAGYMSNRLRFPLYYHDAFIELVKLGVVIPAFDGFEETLVVNASGDAYSAIGHLMSALDQQGSIVISARKAFFEYQELRLQAKLYDSIGSKAVAFSRIQLLRWNRSQFQRYASLRGYTEPVQLFDAVATALHSEEHALLTRAVLANRLVTVATEQVSLEGLLRRLGATPMDYFPVFVNALIEREVMEKWLTSGGEAAVPLLSVEEHRDLLAMIAQEMWLHATDALKPDILELVSTFFCEGQRKSPAIAQQVQQRIKQHALLVPTDASKNSFSFDHEEFKNYFLGLAIAKLIASTKSLRDADLLAILRRGALPLDVTANICSTVKQGDVSAIRRILESVIQLAKLDPSSSFMHENCASLAIGLLSHSPVKEFTLEDLSFSGDALDAASFDHATFSRCSFRSTKTTASSFIKCQFTECKFDRLDLSKLEPANVDSTTLDRCSFSSIVPRDKDIAVFDPDFFNVALRASGFLVKQAEKIETTPAEVTQADHEFEMIDKVIRCFSGRNFITGSVIKLRCGKNASEVIGETVPKLEAHGVLARETYRGAGKDSLFKVGMSMTQLMDIIDRSAGRSDEFYRLVGTRSRASDAK